jgi:hypothetical protein
MRERILEIVNSDFQSFPKIEEIFIETLTTNLSSDEKAQSELQQKIKSLGSNINKIDNYVNLIKEFSSHIENIRVNFDSFLEIEALAQSKILLLFRHIELATKKCIETAYPNLISNGLYRHDTLISFFSTKNINFKKIDQYRLYNELRLVNNNIKHGNEINSQVDKIEEFKNKTTFRIFPLIEFYNRIEKPSLQFLKNIGETIVMDLYEFDDIRISNLAQEFKSRMNSNDMSTFLKELKK